ncbi:MAG: glycerophosphodiester phosphodiesterase family protein [Paracoccaceae bacterium]
MAEPPVVPLPAAFLRAPIAHRALHDLRAGRPENSLAAVRAAVAAGYGIEIDIQPSADGVPMVFHDHDLPRLAGRQGAVHDFPAAELASMPLQGTAERIPTLAEVLAAVAGRVAVLIEVKDQTAMGAAGTGPFEAAIARVLAASAGPVAVMSYNPHTVAALAEAAPAVARGLTVGGPVDSTYGGLPADRALHLADAGDFDRVGASFISCDRQYLHRPAIVRLKARGVPVLCWTIRSPGQEAEARRIADNVTFEGYPADIPAA